MVKEIAIKDLKLHPSNVRKDYEGIDELAASIKTNGILQNLTVVPDKDDKGKFIVVIGNRRLTAAIQAGIETAPCNVVDNMSDIDQVTTMLTENMNRRDLKVHEEAQGIQMCLTDFGIDMGTLEEKTGLSETTIRHRANIAKLNQKELKKKEEDPEFQLTLTDLYSLEQIDDIKTRDKVLKEATDSNNLAYRAQMAAQDEKCKRNEKEWRKRFKKLKIEEIESNKAHTYDGNKWHRVSMYYLKDDMPEEDEFVKDMQDDIVKEYGALRFVKSYSTIEVGQVIPKQKKEPTEFDLRERERKKRIREIKAKYREALDAMHVVLMSIIDGKTKALKAKEQEAAAEELWEILMGLGAWLSYSATTTAMLGKELYDKSVKEEDLSKAEEKGRQLSTYHQMMAITWAKLLDSNISDQYYPRYAKKTGECAMRFANLLETYGFSFESEESMRILDGTHDLYEKEEKKDDGVPDAAEGMGEDEDGGLEAEGDLDGVASDNDEDVV